MLVSESVQNKFTKEIFQMNTKNLYKIPTDAKTLTSAKIQPFCRKYNINLGIYNKKQQSILPKTITERRICLLIHENHFCVIWKTN